MKKVLWASTALVLTSGMAWADVTNQESALGVNINLDGEAQMGVGYDEDAENEFSTISTAEIEFQMTGETDTGLTFGAIFTIGAGEGVNADDIFGDEDDDGQIGPGETLSSGEEFAVIGDAEVFVSGVFGTLAMGDVDDGLNALDVGLPELGLEGLSVDDTVEDVYDAISADTLYTQTVAGFAFAASVELNDEESAADGDYALSIGYEVEDLGLAFSLGYGRDQDEDSDIYAVGLGYTIPDLVSLSLQYNDDEEAGEAYGVAAAFTVSDITFTAMYTEWDDQDEEAYGLGAEYDLGGGASLIGAVASVDDNTVGNFGVNMEF